MLALAALALFAIGLLMIASADSSADGHASALLRRNALDKARLRTGASAWAGSSDGLKHEVAEADCDPRQPQTVAMSDM